MLGQKEISVQTKTKHSFDSAHIMVGHGKVLKFEIRHLLWLILFALLNAEVIYFNFEYLVLEILRSIMRFLQEIRDRSMIISIHSFESISGVPHGNHIFSDIGQVQVEIISP